VARVPQSPSDDLIATNSYRVPASARPREFIGQPSGVAQRHVRLESSGSLTRTRSPKTLVCEPPSCGITGSVASS